MIEGKGEDLKGTTMKVYRHILRVGRPIRITEVQKDLGLSSPSLAQYHMKKLENMGLIREEQEGYVINRLIIEQVFRLRRMLIPFQTAYVVFFSITLLSMLLLIKSTFTSFDLIAFGANIGALGISLYEMFRILERLN